MKKAEYLKSLVGGCWSWFCKPSARFGLGLTRNSKCQFNDDEKFNLLHTIWGLIQKRREGTKTKLKNSTKDNTLEICKLE